MRPRSPTVGSDVTTIASLSMSVDGFVAGPDDRPGQGLGVGGERLHHRVFGGPWTYDGERDPDAVPGEDEAYYDGPIERIGSDVVGRGRYDAAGTWGGENPFPGPLIVLRTAPGDRTTTPTFVDGLDQALRAGPVRRPGTRT